jgi:hypothetical protein
MTAIAAERESLREIEEFARSTRSGDLGVETAAANVAGDLDDADNHDSGAA